MIRHGYNNEWSETGGGVARARQSPASRERGLESALARRCAPARRALPADAQRVRSYACLFLSPTASGTRMTSLSFHRSKCTVVGSENPSNEFESVVTTFLR